MVHIFLIRSTLIAFCHFFFSYFSLLSFFFFLFIKSQQGSCHVHQRINYLYCCSFLYLKRKILSNLIISATRSLLFCILLINGLGLTEIFIEFGIMSRGHGHISETIINPLKKLLNNNFSAEIFFFLKNRKN